MKQTLPIFTVFIIFLFVLGSGCTSKEQEFEKSQTFTTTMRLEGSVNGFADIISKAPAQNLSADHIWKDGDKMYILFTVNTKKVNGIAVYQDAAQSWSLNYEDYLPTDTEGFCEVRWFENANFSNDYIVSLNSQSIVYADTSAQYVVSEEGDVVIHAVLSPTSGRIRFAGNSGTKVFLSGIRYYSSFSPSNNTFMYDTKVDSMTVQEDGYTPYVYGSIVSDENGNRRLGVVTSDGNAFTRNCKNSILATGQSGWMNLPTENAHIGWQRGFIITIQNAEFKMLPVLNGTSLFLMAETETTTQQYEYQTQEETPYNYPKTYVSYNECINYIANLNAISPFSLPFDIPTLEEWQYAFSGGLYSQSFTYAGSNNIDDVAWYSGNTNESHPVKQKAPNELGLYDMSGNVAEWVSSYPSYYSSERYYMGGDYYHNASYCKVDANLYTYMNNYYRYIGFRMIIRIPN